MTSSFRRNARLQARFLMAMTGMLAVQSPARGQEIIPPKVYTLSPGGVNMSDGSFTGSATDLVIGPLSLDRFNLDGLRDPNTMFFGWPDTSSGIFSAVEIKRLVELTQTAKG